jgi:hypothetical protein
MEEEEERWGRFFSECEFSGFVLRSICPLYVLVYEKIKYNNK